MSTASERRAKVDALRSQTRKYLLERRGRRRGAPIAPEPEVDAAPPPSLISVGIVPDADIVALSPALIEEVCPETVASPPAEALAASESAASAPRHVLKELPLGALRLLGQGMIWRLNNLGIHTLDELAACDPQRLSDGLGPIGRLLRTEIWIEAAREILAQE